MLYLLTAAVLYGRFPQPSTDQGELEKNEAVHTIVTDPVDWIESQDDFFDPVDTGGTA